MDTYEVEKLLRNQRIVNLNTQNELTSILAEKAQIIICEENKIIVNQGEQTNDIYFILRGEVVIEVNGRKKAIRKYGDQVGEMALVNLGAPRSATIVARENTVLAKVDERTFSDIADKHPQLWKNIAKTLAERLLERNTSEQRQKNELPRIFIASSRENIEDLNLIKQYLEENNDFVVEPWTDENMFKPSTYTLPTLEKQAELSDFAIILFEFDDKLESRDQNYSSVRDNVILELGLFVGAMGRERVFIVQPEAVDDEKYKIPSDLFGINPICFKKSEKEESLKTVCGIISQVIYEKGTI